MNKKLHNRIEYSLIIIVGIFILFISIPLLITISTPDKLQSLTENRILSTLPNFDLKLSSVLSYPNRFEVYFNDQFGLKDTLIFLNNYLKVKFLKKSPRPEVILGKNGWFFLKSNWVEKQTVEQLEAVKFHLETKRNWLEQKGVRYIYAPAPNKQSIYPEYLLKTSFTQKQYSPMDDLIQYLKSTSDLQILDLRQSLLNSKTDELVYYLTDHHWNHTGAFIAYQDIIIKLKEWFPELTPIPKERFESKLFYLNRGTLVNMLGLADCFQEKKTHMLRLKQACSETMPFNQMLPAWSKKGENEREKEWYQKRIPLQTICQQANLKAIVFRDSFFSTMIPFFSEHFRNVVYIWTKFDYSVLPELIDKIQPDIVIEECQESEVFLPFIDQEIHKTKGFDYLISGKTEAAVNAFEKALIQNPSDADNQNNLGYALSQVRRFDEAIIRFQKALRINPHHIKAKKNFDSTIKLITNLDSAIIEQQKKIHQSPTNLNLRIKLGTLFQRRGNFHAAISEYQIILAAQPNNETVLNNLAITYATVKEYNQSAMIFEQLIKLEPQKADVYYNLACIYALQKNISKSVDSLKTAIHYGYRNSDRIKYDHDLDNIRKTNFYKTLLAQLETPQTPRK